jgi:HCOMODA/2-hydroxy-3-carboxy-muconic semialdehyde decarboxylase
MSLIQDLVVAYRVLAEHGVIDAYGHVSVRSDRDPGRYLLARHIAPEFVREVDIIEYDLDSNPIDANGRLSVRERYIHGEIYKARPDVMCVVHNHSPSVIPFSTTRAMLRPIFHMSAFVGLGVPNFEIRDAQKGTDLLVKTPYLGAALARTLGAHPAALMRGHGCVTVGETIARAVGRSVYLEINARMQMQAMQLAGSGEEVAFMHDDEVAVSAARQEYDRAWHLWKLKTLARMATEDTALLDAAGGPPPQHA